MYQSWLIGLVRNRSGRLFGTIGGVALTVAFIACLGAFLQSSAVEMTARSIAQVPVDWQVQLLPEADIAAVEAAIRSAAPATELQQVGYADVPGFEANTGDTVQATGGGMVLGIEPSYLAQFPAQVRRLLGSADGVLMAQQTAANLHVAVGDQVVVHRHQAPDISVTIAGIVDLPNADAIFQAVGVPAGAAPQAPPDNVLLLPMSQWQQVFGPQRASRPDTVWTEFHVKLDHHDFPSDPVAASTRATERGHNFEARVAGAALLANNLAARLEAVREDTLYARLIFLFLGAPGAILAILLTLAVAGAGRDKRRRDQALLRLRGATVGAVLRLAAAEAAVAGAGGAIVGILLGAVAAHFVLGLALLRSEAVALLGTVAGVGVTLALAAILIPAWRDARGSTVAAARRSIGDLREPFWARGYVDSMLLLALAAAFYWRSAANGYQVVLAPEGVAATAVDYTAFLAPILLWTGLALFVMRLVGAGLRRGRPIIAKGLRPIAGRLANVVAATFARQGPRLTVGIGLIALAFAFAASTAIFNATYEAQARVDAELTNGADVTVTGTFAEPASQALDRLSSCRACSPLS
ncbi:FtsX-like permease family protein [Rhizobium beringeri]